MRDDLAVEALARIERNPRMWWQGHFPFYSGPLACQTAFCFAGHVMAAAGHTEWRGPAVALDVLELQFDEDDADRHQLFRGGNTLDDLYRMVAEEAGLAEAVVRDKVRELQDASA